MVQTLYLVQGRDKPVFHGPNSTEPNMFHHGETTYRVVGLSENSTVMRTLVHIRGKVIASLIISESCQKVAVNFAAVGEDTLMFPQGKIMTLHQTLESGFEYEVCSRSIGHFYRVNTKSYSSTKSFTRKGS